MTREQVQRTVDLDDDPATVSAAPFCVQVAAPPARISANRLSGRRRQTVPPTQPSEIDLTQRLGALSDVMYRGEQVRAVTGSRRGLDGACQFARVNQPLLNRRGEDPERRAPGVEAAGRHNHRRADAVQAAT
ncbi:MAG TPA: hypothetical protein VIM22_03945, partial [Solirubrobacteraceae bacterium]